MIFSADQFLSRSRSRRLAPVVFSIVALIGAHSSVFAADQSVIDAAKKEGEVVWYTTQIVDQITRPIAEAFQRRYGVKVTFVRTDSNNAVLRVVNEGRAGRVQGDVVDGQSAAATLKKQGFVLQWVPDAAVDLPKQYIDPEGYWTATNLLVIEPGFNTNLVPKGTEPRTWNALVDPKWKGKMAWNANPGGSTGPAFVGLVLHEWGEDKGMAYLRQLAGQNIAGLTSGGHDVVDQVIAGEYAIGLQLGNNQVEFESRRGAPIAWIPMQPALVIMSAISIVKGAPHPNAGKLLVDFILSEEAQRLFRDADYIPVDPKTEPSDPSLRPDGVKFRAVTMTPEELDGSMGGWKKIFDGLFR